MTYYAINSHTVAIQWHPPAIYHQNGIIRKYVVQVLEASDSSNTIMTYNTTSTTAVIGSLIPSFTYKFSVAAYTIAIGPYTALINMTLPEDGKFLLHMS